MKRDEILLEAGTNELEIVEFYLDEEELAAKRKAAQAAKGGKK